MPDSVISESLSSIVLASGNAGMNGYTTNSFGGNPAEYGSLLPVDLSGLPVRYRVQHFVALQQLHGASTPDAARAESCPRMRTADATDAEFAGLGKTTLGNSTGPNW